jgi:hypothetical protein
MMNPTLQLNSVPLHTYKKIFAHPVSHDLEWHEVRSLLEKLCSVVEKNNGTLSATRNGHTDLLQPPHHGNHLNPDTVIQLRRFLERSEIPLEMVADELHWLVVLDHHEARIYRSELRGTMPARIQPHEPGSHFRHTHNAKEFSRGKDKPDMDTFFCPIAAELKAAREIVLIGSGTGNASEMEQFRVWLEHRHPDLSRRIVGSLKVNQNHLTEAQILAKAREYYASVHAKLI